MRDRRGLHRRLWTSLLICLLTAGVLWPVCAFARAGGGGGYHGGGGGGGHGGGGAGGAIELIIDLIILIVEYPYVGIPVVLIIIFLFIVAAFQGKTAADSKTIRKGAGVIHRDKVDQVLVKLRSHDTAFNEAAFRGRVETAFKKIQAAWDAQNLREVRPFITDGVHERFTLQFEEQREIGYHNRMLQVQVLDATIVDLAGEGSFDEIAVRIRAKAVDYRASLGDDRFISGSRSSEAFTEYWSFLRRRGTQTKSTAGLIEGNCPNCGAAIALNESANCRNCNALLRSGAFDWVLAEITQESEWNGLPRGSAPGVRELRKRDPDFDVLALEDRASVIFWRKTATDRTGKIAPLRKCASPDFCQGYERTMNALRGMSREFQGDCAVGAVLTRGIIPGNGPQDVDRALVEIRWAGTRHIANPGQPPHSTGDYSLFRTLFVLARATGVKSVLGKSIDSAHCPNCGAPETRSEASSCEFCGTVLNDGNNGWVLIGSCPTTSTEGKQLLSELEPAGSARRDADTPPASTLLTNPVPLLDANSLLAWLVRVAVADGTVDPREMTLLNTFAFRRGIPTDRVNQLITAAQNGTLDSPMPANGKEARAWIGEMIDMSLADGNVDRTERAVLQSVAERMGIGSATVNGMITEHRREHLNEAREAIHAAKGAKKQGK